MVSMLAAFERSPYLPLPPMRPGFPGVPPSSSFDRLGFPWFELPGSQPSGPLPTPWLHLLCDLPPPVALQLVTMTSVNVTAAFAKASPLKVVVVGVPARPVMVMAAPTRMVPCRPVVVIVAACLMHH